MKKNSLLKKEYVSEKSAREIVVVSLLKTLCICIIILLLLNPNVMNFVKENIYNQVDMEANKFWITTSLISIPFILIIGTCIGFIKLNISSLKNK